MSLRGEVIRTSFFSVLRARTLIQLSSLAVHGRRAAQFNGQGFSIYPLAAPLVWLEVYEAVEAASRFLADHPYTVLDLPALVFSTARCLIPGRGPTRWPPEAIAAFRQPSLAATTEDEDADLPPHSDVDSPIESEDEDAEDHARRRLESIPPAIPPPPAPSAANLRHHPVRAYDVNAEIEKLRQQYDKATRRLKAAVQACQTARAKADALPENTWDRNLAEAYVRRAKEALKVAVAKEAAAEDVLRNAVEQREATRSSHRHSV